MRSVKVMASELSPGFHRVACRACPRLVGSGDRTTREGVFSVAYWVAKWFLAFTARRNRGFRLSIALVEHKASRISRS